jgi:hypothetical protein
VAEPIGALRVELSTSIAKFEADLGKARKAASNFSTGVNKSLKDMGGGFGGLTSQIGKMAASFAIATVAVNAISSAIRGSLGFIKDSISASAAQTTQEKTLAKAIENTGVSYASVRDEINQTLVTIQRSTKFADDEQRPVLQTLIALTGDYKTSLKALPTVLDASVALQQDAKTTALLFAKAIAGNISSLSRYGITLDETTQKLIKQATPAEALELLTKALGDRWKGLAESEAADFEGQLIQLTNAWGDLKETIGDFITKSPQVQDAINKIEDRIFKWIDALEKNKEAQEKFEEFLESSIETLESFANAFILIIEKGAQFHNFLAETGKKIGQFIADLELIQQPIAKAVERLDLTPLTKGQETLVTSLSEVGVAFELTTKTVKEDTKAVETNREEIVKHSEAAKKGKSAVDQLNDSFKKQIETLEKQVATFGLTAEQIIEFDRQLAISKGVIPEVANKVADLSLELNDLEEAAKETAEAWEELFSMDEEIAALQEELDQIDFQAFLDKTEPQVDSFTQFVGSAFANMGQDIGDAIINAGNVWKAVINSMKRVVADLIGFLIANPIRLLFEGATTGGVNIFSGITNIFSTGFSAITDILKGAFSGITGLFSLIGGALPLIGTIASVVTVGISLISKLFEKAPEVHIDIGRFNTEIDDRLALVSDFIELSDDVNSDLAKDLVTIHKGKIGIDNTELRQIIFDKINAVISGIQEMLFQLPVDLATSLNEALLNTELIDFDEATKRIIGIDYTGKEAAKRLEDFLNSGEMEAEFIASISPFFEEFYKQIGVLPDAAIRLVDEFTAEFAAAPNEAQTALGQAFLAQMQAYIDAFNFLNDIAADSFQAAINQIEALSIDLGLVEEGIPSLEEAKAALQALFDAGELTPEIVEKFIALGEAIELFNQAVDDMYDKISQFAEGAFEVAINDIKKLSEELGITTEGLVPSLKEVQDALFDLLGSADITEEAFRELVATGQITPELIDKFSSLRQAIIDLSMSLASSIQTILSTIQQLNQSIFDLGGDIVPTSGFIQDQIAILMDMLNEEGITLEERIAIIDQLNQLANDLNAAFIQENTLQRERIENAQNMVDAINEEIVAVNASIDALRLQADQIEANFELQIAALEEEKDLISEISQERISALEDELSAIESAFGLREESQFAIVEELHALEDLRDQTESYYDERIALATDIAEREKDLIREVFGELTSVLEAEKSALESAFDITEEQEYALVQQLEALEALKPQIEENFQARQSALEDEKDLINEIFRDRISALEAEQSAIASAFSLSTGAEYALIEELKALEEVNTAELERIDSLKSEQDAIESAFGLREEEEFLLVEQLKTLQDLRDQVESDFDERIKLAEEEHENQIDLLNESYKLSIDSIEAEIDALEDLLTIAESFRDLVSTIADDILQVSLVGKVPEQQIGIIRSLIGLEEAILNTLEGEAKLESFEKLRDLNLQLFEIAQSAFQEPSLDFQALQTEVIRNLEDLQVIAEEEAAKAEDIQERIASANESIALINGRIEANTGSISSEVQSLIAQQEQQLSAIDAQIVALTVEAQKRIEQLIIEQAEGLQAIDDSVEALTNEAQSRLDEIASELESLAGQEADALASIDAQIASLAGQEADALASIDAQIAILTEEAKARLEEINVELEELAKEEQRQLDAIDQRLAHLAAQEVAALQAIDDEIAALTVEAQQRLDEIIIELEQLRLEEEQALAAIDAEIQSLEAQQAAALASIDAQIAAANQQLIVLNTQLATQTAILTEEAQLTAEQQAELLALFEAIRELELIALQETLTQQAELLSITEASFELEIEQVVLLSQIRDLLSGIALAPVESFQHGGLVQNTGLKLLHAGEFVLPSDFEGGSTRNVNIAVNVNGNIPSSPTAINMLSDSLVSKIKDEIVEDMEYGKLGKVTVRRVGLA